MADILTTTPPYDYSFKDSITGVNGRIVNHEANKANGKLWLNIGTNPMPGIAIQTTTTVALSAVGIILDPPPRRTLKVEANLNNILDLRLRSRNRSISRSQGYNGLLVIELDQNFNPVAIPIFEVKTLWNLRGSVSSNFNTPDHVLGQTTISLGHTYKVWIWAAVLVQIEKTRAIQDLTSFSTADFVSNVNSIVSTII